MLRQRSAFGVDEPLRVNEVDALARLVGREPVEGEEAPELHGDAYASRPGAEEQDAVLAERLARRGGGELGGIDEAGQHDGARTLDLRTR